MKSKTKTWLISELQQKEALINPKPQYQRTPVWTGDKKKLLIDSILNGYDLPKFYFRRTPQDPTFAYEVADGQQRLIAILGFLKNKFKLDIIEVDSIQYRGVFYRDLPDELKEKFNSYQLSISIVKEATNNEIRTLFARLQMGVNLNPAELRHALASNLGFLIQGLVDNHDFFPESKILNNRYKHQDYVDHVVSIAYYGENQSLKAPNLRVLYTSNAGISHLEAMPVFAKINKVLDWMHSINSCHKGVLRNKWGFVDTFNLLFKEFDNIQNINAIAFARKLVAFESKRKKFVRNPKELLATPDMENEKLFEYINAFVREGGEKNNIVIRGKVFCFFFNNEACLEFKKAKAA